MKKIRDVLMIIVAVAISQLAIHFVKQCDNYRTMSGSITKGGVEYAFVGALKPFRTNDVEKVSGVLEQRALTVLVERPDIVEIWVPVDQAEEAKSLFVIDSQGLIVAGLCPAAKLPVAVKILIIACMAAIILVLLWWIESRFRRKEKEAIGQMLKEASAESLFSAGDDG
jgi:hypothetical protein